MTDRCSDQRPSISSLSIRHPVPAAILSMVLVLLGIVAFLRLPVTRAPNVDMPFVQMVVNQPGAAPGELESQVTKRVEDEVGALPGVRHVASVVTDGLSTTTIEFRLATSTDRAVNDVKEAVSRIRSDLPQGIHEPIVQRVEFEAAPILTFAVANPAKTDEEISWFVDDVVERRLRLLRGVGNVDRVGGIDREIRVLLRTDRLNSLGVTAADINAQLEVTSADSAGGRSAFADREQAIRTLGGATSLDGLANTMIALPGNRKTRLSDLGSVVNGAAEPRIFARLNGQPVVAFQVFRSKGASDNDVAERVHAALDDLLRDHAGYNLTLIDTSVDYTIGNFRSAMKALVEGGVLAVIVVFLFLRDLRATLIAALVLPLAVFPTFWAMSALGFSLNFVTLLAITMITGVLVDDAIVEIENIFRHMERGKSPGRAAADGADEIGLTVIAITLTIVAVFVPVSFMDGMAGQYLKEFGLTMAVAVLMSLLVARFVTPVLAANFLRRGVRHAAADGRVMAAYTAVVRFAATHRFATMALGIAIFALSIYCTTLLPTGFVPSVDEGRVVFAVELPPGARLKDTRVVGDRIAGLLKRRPEVAAVFVNGGTVMGGGNEIRKATVVVRLVHKSARLLTQKQVEAVVAADLATIPDIRYWALQANGQRGVSFILDGVDGAEASRLSRAIVGDMKRVPILANPTSTAPLDRPELQIRPRGDLAADLGVSTDSIAETIRLATMGDMDTNLAKYKIGDRLIPIRVQLAENVRSNMAALSSLRVPTASGSAVPLGAVATIDFGLGPTSIDRYDRARRFAVEADLVGSASLGQAMDSIAELPSVKALPPGITLKQTGDAEMQTEVFSSFFLAMGAGILVVYVVLVILLGGLLKPVTILLSLPLSVGGMIFALWITGEAVSVPVVIGALMLIGVVTKNAIMLVDFAVESMARGVSRLDAIVDAGRKRARPIVMTTAAMTAGMLPSTLAIGDGGEFRAPMAIGVIGGLLVSTLLSLVFVPAFFTVTDGLERWLALSLARIFGQNREDATSLRPGQSVADESFPRFAEQDA